MMTTKCGADNDKDGDDDDCDNNDADSLLWLSDNIGMIFLTLVNIRSNLVVRIGNGRRQARSS